MPDVTIATLEADPEWATFTPKERRQVAERWVRSRPEFASLEPQEQQAVVNRAQARYPDAPPAAAPVPRGPIYGPPTSMLNTPAARLNRAVAALQAQGQRDADNAGPIAGTMRPGIRALIAPPHPPGELERWVAQQPTPASRAWQQIYAHGSQGQELPPETMRVGELSHAPGGTRRLGNASKLARAAKSEAIAAETGIGGALSFALDALLTGMVPTPYDTQEDAALKVGLLAAGGALPRLGAQAGAGAAGYLLGPHAAAMGARVGAPAAEMMLTAPMMGPAALEAAQQGDIAKALGIGAFAAAPAVMGALRGLGRPEEVPTGRPSLPEMAAYRQQAAARPQAQQARPAAPVEAAQGVQTAAELRAKYPNLEFTIDKDPNGHYSIGISHGATEALYHKVYGWTVAPGEAPAVARVDRILEREGIAARQSVPTGATHRQVAARDIRWLAQEGDRFRVVGPDGKPGALVPQSQVEKYPPAPAPTQPSTPAAAPAHAVGDVVTNAKGQARGRIEAVDTSGPVPVYTVDDVAQGRRVQVPEPAITATVKGTAPEERAAVEGAGLVTREGATRPGFAPDNVVGWEGPSKVIQGPGPLKSGEVRQTVATNKQTGERVWMLSKTSWGHSYYSFDYGKTWSRTKAEAYTQARESGQLLDANAPVRYSAPQPVQPPTPPTGPAPIVLGGENAALGREVGRRVRAAQQGEGAAVAEPVAAAATTPDTEATTIVRGAPIREVPVASLVVQDRVPNLKAGADPKTGVVRGQALEGDYERVGTAPIVVWERNDGVLEVITGRHRLDLARRNGDATIPAQIVREADGFTQTKAAILDAETNIRDGKGEVNDYARYFANTRGQYTEAVARERGLLQTAKGRAGWDIGHNASDDLRALYFKGEITEPQAVAIAHAAPGDATLQQVGARYALKGRDPAFLSNVLQAVKAAPPVEGQTDLFGGNDSALRTAEAQAQRASEIQKEIRQRVSSASGASKYPEAAKALGVDVNDPEAVQREVSRLRDELKRWEQWALHPDLVQRTLGAPETARPRTAALELGEEPTPPAPAEPVAPARAGTAQGEGAKGAGGAPSARERELGEKIHSHINWLEADVRVGKLSESDSAALKQQIAALKRQRTNELGSQLTGTSRKMLERDIADLEAQLGAGKVEHRPLTYEEQLAVHQWPNYWTPSELAEQAEYLALRAAREGKPVPTSPKPTPPAPAAPVAPARPAAAQGKGLGSPDDLTPMNAGIDPRQLDDLSIPRAIVADRGKTPAPPTATAEGTPTTPPPPPLTVERKPADFGLGQTVQTPLSVLDRPGIYARFGGELGKQVDAAFRTAQTSLRRNNTTWQRAVDTVMAHLNEARRTLRLKPDEMAREFVDLVEKPLDDAERIAVAQSDTPQGRALRAHDQMAETVRQFVIRSRRDFGIETPDDWGITEQGYFRHMFLGDLVLLKREPDGSLSFVNSARTYVEAQAEVMKLLQQDPEAAFVVRARDITKGDPTLRISNNRYWKTVADIADQVELSKEDVMADLRGIIGRKAARQKWLGALLERKGYEGYSKDYERVMRAHVAQVARWQALTDLNRKAQPKIEALRRAGLSGLAEVMEGHIRQLWGTPDPIERFVGNAIRNTPVLRNHVAAPDMALRTVAERLARLQTLLKLKYNLKSSLVNLVQPLQTMWPYVDTKTLASLYAEYAKPATRQMLAERGVLDTGTKLESGTPVVRARASTGQALLRGPFTAASNVNRAIGYLHGLREAKRLGLEGDAADFHAFQWAERVEFDNSTWNAPPVLRSALGRLLLQFKGFTIKSVETGLHMAHRQAGETPLRPAARLAKAAVGTGVAGGIRATGALTKITGGYLLVTALSRQLQKAGVKKEDADKAAEAVYYGAPSLVGADLSGSVAFLDVPISDSTAGTVSKYLAGPTLSSAFDASDALLKTWRAADPAKKREIAGRFAQRLTPYARQADTLQQWYRHHGFGAVSLPVGNQQTLRLQPRDALLRFLGFTPVAQTRHYDKRDAKQGTPAAATRGGSSSYVPAGYGL